MATYKRTGPDGFDYAFPSKKPAPPKPPAPSCPPPSVPPCPPPPPYPEWEVYPFYPPYPDMEAEPVPTPPIPGRPGPGPVPSCSPHRPVPPCPTHPPVPPYAPPKPERVDECSKKLAKLSQKSKVLVQMIKDFEQKNKPVIITIGANSYQFGTNMVTDFDGEPAKGMYAELICGKAIEELEEDTYEIDKDDTKTRVALTEPEDLLQSELARIRKEITLVAAALNEEVSDLDNPPEPRGYVLGVD